MKHVFSAHAPQTVLHRDLLEAAGIPCEIRHDTEFPLPEDLPSITKLAILNARRVEREILDNPEFTPQPVVPYITELWVLNDADFERARSLILSEDRFRISDADRVWNRALSPEAGSPLREGDTALRDLLIAHGHIMNGGMSAARDCMKEEQRKAAAAGYRYFGFEELAAIIDEIENGSKSDHETADNRYYDLIPRDSVLSERFEGKLRSNPEAFAPV